MASGHWSDGIGGAFLTRAAVAEARARNHWLLGNLARLAEAVRSENVKGNVIRITLEQSPGDKDAGGAVRDRNNAAVELLGLLACFQDRGC